MTVYVGSLQYSPVFKSHSVAFGKACEKEGYHVKYIFSGAYEWLLPKEIRDKTIFIGHSTGIFSMFKDASSLKNRKKIAQIFAEDKPICFYMQNYHFLNHYIASLCKKHGCKFIYHVHEPYVEDKNAHGGFSQYWLYLFEYFQGKLLKDTAVAIVSSNEALRLLDLKYPKLSGKKMLVPLMYEDLGGMSLDSQKREYVTFIGPLLPAKNPEKFLEIIDYSKGRNLNLKFLLISRHKVRDERFLKEVDLKIVDGERISDEEYGNLIGRSYAVLVPYKRETQSSVILVSYMYGTPVISSTIGGLPEFVIPMKTGYLLDSNASAEEWINIISKVQKNIRELSENCRKYFIMNFSGEHWKEYLGVLLDECS
jgi:glycosyltransferase involved in cell wall biosynthesis